MSKVTRLNVEEDGELSRKRIHLREISGDLDAALESVGQDLRAARLRRGDDLATVSKALKIRKDHLEALEEGRIGDLPGRTYAVGFVRTYADYLGLGAAQYVERYKAEIEGRTEEREPPPYADELDTTRFPYGWVVVGVIILAVIAYGTYRFATAPDSASNQPVAAVPAQMVAKPEMAPAPHPQPAVSAPAKMAPAQAMSGATPPAAVPEGQKYGLGNEGSRVLLRVTAQTRLLVTGAGAKTYINRMLQPGDSYRVPNATGLTLTTPNGGAVQVELDGQAMGVAGQPSQVVEGLSLDPQAIADRSHGHHG
ncbi:MAG TPA: RodZ domain-containing protein [Rhizomicrobium sp.]|jgi:cytoskeleton protein RodZ